MDVATDPVENSRPRCLGRAQLDELWLMIAADDISATRLDDIADALPAEQSSAGQPRAAVPTWFFAGFRTSGALAPTLVLAEG